MPSDRPKQPQPPRFMVSITFMETDWYDALVDEGGYEAVVGVLCLLARLKSRDRNESDRSGFFASEGALRRALGEFSKFIPMYRKVGVLDGLTTPLWDWQTKYDNNPTRQRKYRESKRADAAHPSGDVTDDVTRDTENQNQKEKPKANSKGYPSGTSKGPDDGWENWVAPDFREAWASRGFEMPPTMEQQAVVRDALTAWPGHSVVWLQEAPHDGPVADVVGFVLDRYHEAVRQHGQFEGSSAKGLDGERGG